ncbi:MAG: hypothetical protein ACPG45_06765 [Flavobacteriaceae bacterium]
MRQILNILVLVICTTVMCAQDVSSLNFKIDGYAQKKFNETDKKIYIQHFFVNYQVMMSASEIARGGREIGGGYRGDAKASLSLGIKGVELEDYQNMTNEFYNDFVKQLTDKGFTIMTAQEVQGNVNFSKENVVEGGSPASSDIPGYLSTTPKGYSFLTGGSGAFNMAGMPQSKKLGGVIVARVYITVPFLENGESQGSRALTKSFGGVAKVVLKPNLRLSPLESVPVAGDFKKPKNTVTDVTFAYKKNLKYQALYRGKLKKPTEINGVFENKKYKSVSSASQDLWGSEVGTFKVFNVQDKELERMQSVACEKEKYVGGVTTAVTEYLNASVSGFLSYIK